MLKRYKHCGSDEEASGEGFTSFENWESKGGVSGVYTYFSQKGSLKRNFPKLGIPFGAPLHRPAGTWHAVFSH